MHQSTSSVLEKKTNPLIIPWHKVLLETLITNRVSRNPPPFTEPKV